MGLVIFAALLEICLPLLPGPPATMKRLRTKSYVASIYLIGGSHTEPTHQEGGTYEYN